jgi:hypothetical protein
MIDQADYIGHSELQFSKNLRKVMSMLIFFAIFVIFWIEFILFLVKINDHFLEIQKFMVVFLCLKVYSILKYIFQEHKNGAVNFIVVYKRIWFTDSNPVFLKSYHLCTHFSSAYRWSYKKRLKADSFYIGFRSN